MSHLSEIYIENKLNLLLNIISHLMKWLVYFYRYVNKLIKLMEGYDKMLTDELVDKFDKAETMEEKKAILAQAGMEFTDDELENVAGGMMAGIKFAKCSRTGCGFVKSLNRHNPIPPRECPNCGSKLNIRSMR